MLEIHDLEVRYGGIRAVKGVSLQVGAGELICLIGANGAGKSSTLKAICGLVRDWVPESQLVRGGLWDRVHVVRGDVTDQRLLERVLGEYEIDTVLHLAAQTIVGIANRNPVSTLETNVAGTWRLLEACRRSPRVRQIVLGPGQHDLGVAGDLHFPRPIAAVGDRQAPDLHVVLGRDHHLELGLEVAVAALQRRLVELEDRLVLVGLPADRLVARRPDAARPRIPQVDLGNVPQRIAGLDDVFVRGVGAQRDIAAGRDGPGGVLGRGGLRNRACREGQTRHHAEHYCRTNLRSRSLHAPNTLHCLDHRYPVPYRRDRAL